MSVAVAHPLYRMKRLLGVTLLVDIYAVLVTAIRNPKLEQRGQATTHDTEVGLNPV